MQKAKHARKVARGMDGVLYSKFFPTIEPELTIASLKYFIAEVKAGANSVSSWLAKLKADKALSDLLTKTSDEELKALYASVQQVAQAPKSLDALEQAVTKGGKAGVDDADKVLKTLIESKAGNIIKQIDEGAPASQFTKGIDPNIVPGQNWINPDTLKGILLSIQEKGLTTSTMTTLMFYKFSDGTLQITAGHHRLVASHLLGLKFPLKNYQQVIVKELPVPFKMYESNPILWRDIIWQNY